MSREPDPLGEIAKAIEHLARAGEGVLGRVLEPFRAAVQAETKRWEKRSIDDPTAARVHEVFQTLLEVLQDLERGSGSAPSPRGTRSAGEAKEVRSPHTAARLTRRRDRWNTRP